MPKHPALRATLPSAEAAYALVSPDATAIPAVLCTLAGRAALIAIGLRLVRKGNRFLFRDAVGAALALEVFLIVYAGRRTLAFAAAQTSGGGDGAGVGGACFDATSTTTRTRYVNR